MTAEELKILAMCAAGVLMLAGIVVMILLICRSKRKATGVSKNRAAEANSPKADPDQPSFKPLTNRFGDFSVVNEITLIHSQERLDSEDR